MRLVTSVVIEDDIATACFDVMKDIQGRMNIVQDIDGKINVRIPVIPVHQFR